VSGLSVDVEPSEVGLDPRRLDRVGAYFRCFVDDGRLPGWLIVISRAGKVVYIEAAGRRDETGLPIEPDTLLEIYSMTKPVTAVAALICYEEGLFELTDPVSTYIPSFAKVRVFKGGSASSPDTEPVQEPVRIWHLMTHTAGLMYPFSGNNPVVASLFEDAERSVPSGAQLADWCDTWATVPLLFEPGSSWNYSVASDVLGRVVEVASGMPLDAYFSERILDPLQMTDTAFQGRESDPDRLAAMYSLDPVTAKLVVAPPAGRREPGLPYLSGGGGLVSTATDYWRFMEMLRRRGQYGGVEVLAPRTVDFMTRNHLPNNADRASFGIPLFPDKAPEAGEGYGLGVGVTIDPIANRALSGTGSFGWAGAANTYFSVDPKEELTLMFLAQFVPFAAYPIESRFKQLVYQAVID
jgi:CubicO group peptidase (beta-lactamase class C family)